MNKQKLDKMKQNIYKENQVNDVSCFAVAQSHLTLRDPMDRGTPDSSVLCNHLEFAQTHLIYSCPLLLHLQSFHLQSFPASGSFQIS